MHMKILRPMEKFDTSGPQPQTVDMFVRAAKQHYRDVSLFFGRDRGPERLEAISTPRKIHDANPEVSTLHFLITAWGL